MGKKILFVTKGGSACDEGFDYVSGLAETLQAGIEVLIVYPETPRTGFDSLMSSITFAEAGEFESARSLLADTYNEGNEQCREKFASLFKDTPVPVEFFCRMPSGDPALHIREHLAGRPGIDMVLLSPNLASDRKYLDIKKMLRNITKPIVYITRPVGAEA